MQWVELDQGEVDEHGSHGLHLIEAARLTADAHFRVHIAHLAAGGVLGRHPGRYWQLFCVADGQGWVAGPDGRHHRLSTGQAVLWAPQESHESGTESGMTIVTVQSTVRPPHGNENTTHNESA